MTNQEYTELLNDVTTETSFEKACEMLTQLHEERDRRAAEYWSGKRTRNSIKARAFVDAVNAVRARFGKFITYSCNNRYEVKMSY